MENRIKELRKERDWSQAKLAEIVEAHFTTIQKLETGKQKLTTEWMERLAGALNVRPVELIEPPGQITEGKMDQKQELNLSPGQRQIIGLLTQVLDQARRGDMRGIFIVGMAENGSCTFAAATDRSYPIEPLLGAVEVQKQKIILEVGMQQGRRGIIQP